MTVNSNYYMHNSDRSALQALQSIPGFTQVLRAFMKVWNEKQFKIQNMSSNLRISETQMRKYYDMLPPICEKLGIDVPELYLTLDVNANAYTYGDTSPFIVITSGLIETLPEELIPTVLAHECGHIACHHCLYTTMGSILLSGSSTLLSLWGLAELITIPMQIAFSYWMRCSEYSADRAAALYDGSSDKIVEMCMRFAGFDKDLGEGGADKDTFMAQALEYNAMVKDSKWNKTLEFLILSNMDHPLNAVRAYECDKWSKEERFSKMVSYLNVKQCNEIAISSFLKEVPMIDTYKAYIGKNYKEVIQIFEQLGFTNVIARKIPEKGILTKSGEVRSIIINNKNGFNIGDWYSIDSEIIIEYYEPETEEEVAAAHPGQIRMPDNAKKYIGRQYQSVVEELQNNGFSEFKLEKQICEKKMWQKKDGVILRISINGQTQFEKDEWFDKNSLIEIVYQVFPECK